MQHTACMQEAGRLITTRTLERVAANVGLASHAGGARRGPQAVAGRLVVEEALVAQHHIAGPGDGQEAVGLGAAGEQNQGGGQQGKGTAEGSPAGETAGA
jgi:hypothetical protein